MRRILTLRHYCTWKIRKNVEWKRAYRRETNKEKLCVRHDEFIDRTYKTFQERSIWLWSASCRNMYLSVHYWTSEFLHHVDYFHSGSLCRVRILAFEFWIASMLHIHTIGFLTSTYWFFPDSEMCSVSSVLQNPVSPNKIFIVDVLTSTWRIASQPLCLKLFILLQNLTFSVSFTCFKFVLGRKLAHLITPSLNMDFFPIPGHPNNATHPIYPSANRLMESSHFLKRNSLFSLTCSRRKLKIANLDVDHPSVQEVETS